MSERKTIKEVPQPAKVYPELVEMLARLAAFFQIYDVQHIADLLGISKQSFGDQIRKYRKDYED